MSVPASPSGSRASHEAAKASSPEASIPNAVLDAIQMFRRIQATCPYHGSKPPPSTQDCKACGANSGEACRRQVIEAFAVVDAVIAASAIEAQRAETTKIGSVEDESATRKGTPK